MVSLNSTSGASEILVQALGSATKSDALARALTAGTRQALLINALVEDLELVSHGPEEPVNPEKPNQNKFIATKNLFGTSIKKLLRMKTGRTPKRSLLELDANFEVWTSWYDQILNDWLYKPSSSSKLGTFCPDEQWSLKNRSLNKLLIELETNSTSGGGKYHLKRARAIFLGHGGAGKTSIINCLNGGERTQEGQMTKGVSTTTLELDRKCPTLAEVSDQADVKSQIIASGEEETAIHFWDFGGQVMAHGTHQFFLRSGCLYIIVLDSRYSDQATSQVEYWLEYVRAFASEVTPVMIVANKAENPKNLHRS